MLLAGHLGWALDAFDVMLYSFCLTSIAAGWHLDLKQAGFMVSVTLLASSFGGILFGTIADRIGRKKALFFGRTHDATQLMLLGPLIGFFGSGSFSVFGAFIAELFPTRARGAITIFFLPETCGRELA